ncbi:MAG TPA: DUF6600 domain-containing protein [Pyrinomonadaceae bacterium]|nr:DUF6600 domain-containing protein [Pyrinomonadaceae bacterium]
MNRIRIWPHGILIVLGFAAIAAIGAALWVRYERTAEAKSLPNAARIDRVHGQVGVNHSLDNSASNDWTEATQNTPISVGDRVYTRDNSGAEIAFTGRNFATLDPNTSLDVLDLSNQRTQIALRNGSGLFDVGSLGSGNLFEVATPCGAVDLQEAGVYRVAIEDSGNASITALSGHAQLIGQSGSGVIQKGETISVPCQGGSGVLSRVDAGQAGALLDNYYRARYPRKYDGRYHNYYTYLDDPYYYDPYRQDPSYNYVSEYVPGIDDLDYYGDWQYVSDYGYGWHPRVDNGWAPYQSGYWTMDYPYGLTWVSNEPWGYAPYHYGRWANSGNQWYWIPEGTRTYPTYSPALVAFLPFNQSSVAWVPLGPSDPYSYRYYDQSWQPVYYSQPSVIEQRIVNMSVPGAVTVVPVQDFTRVIDPGVVARVDPQTFTRVRPVLDPLTVDPLRRAAFQTREARQRIDVPQTVAQRIANTPVITSTNPSAPPFRRDLAQTLRVQSPPDRVKNQKIQFRDERASTAKNQQGESAPGTSQQQNLAAEQARERQIADLSRQAARGDRNARQQIQDLRRQQVEQQRADRVNAQQAQGERVRQQIQQQQSQRDALGQQQQVQREAARQQMITNQQQRHAAAQQQIQTQREQRRQMVPRAQPPAVRNSERVQQVRPEAAPAQQRERRQPQYRAPQAQPRVVSPPAQRQQRPQPEVRRAQPQMQRAQPQMQRAQPQMQRAQPQPQRVQAQPQRAQPQVQRAQPQPQRVQQQAQPRPQQQSQQSGEKHKKP